MAKQNYDLGQAPGSGYLGLLAGVSLHSNAVPKGDTCDWKGCPYPRYRVVAGFKECLFHTQFWRYPSFLYRGEIDIEDLFAMDGDEMGKRTPYFSIVGNMDVDQLEASLSIERRGYRKRRQNKRISTPRKLRDNVREMLLQQSPLSLKKSQIKSGKRGSAVRKSVRIERRVMNENLILPDGSVVQI